MLLASVAETVYSYFQVSLRLVQRWVNAVLSVATCSLCMHNGDHSVCNNLNPHMHIAPPQTLFSPGYQERLKQETTSGKLSTVSNF